MIGLEKNREGHTNTEAGGGICNYYRRREMLEVHVATCTKTRFSKGIHAVDTYMLPVHRDRFLVQGPEAPHADGGHADAGSGSEMGGGASAGDGAVAGDAGARAGAGGVGERLASGGDVVPGGDSSDNAVVATLDSSSSPSVPSTGPAAGNTQPTRNFVTLQLAAPRWVPAKKRRYANGPNTGYVSVLGGGVVAGDGVVAGSTRGAGGDQRLEDAQLSRALRCVPRAGGSEAHETGGAPTAAAAAQQAEANPSSSSASESAGGGSRSSDLAPGLMEGQEVRREFCVHRPCR